MIQGGHIGRHEIVSLLVFALVPHAFLGLPRVLAVHFQTAGWIALLVGIAITAIGVLPLLSFMTRFPDTSFAGAIEQTLGGIISLPVNVGLSALLFVGATLTTTIFLHAFSVLYYPDTPDAVLTLLAAAIVGYPIYKGVETTGRVAVLTRVPLLVTFVVMMSFVPSILHFQELTPVWGMSAAETLLGGVAFAGLFAPLGILAVYFPYLRPKDRTLGTGYLALGVGGLLTVAIVAIITIVLPVPAVAESNFPLLETIRLIRIGPLLERIEPGFLFIWFFVSITALAALGQASTLILAETLHLPSYRPIVPVLATIAFFTISLPGSLAHAEELFYDWTVPITAVWTYAGGTLLWLVAVLRKKGVPPHA